jgi:hypothetical protein
LSIITDQADTGTATDGELDGAVEGEGVGHAGFVDDQQGRRADRRRPVRELTMIKWPAEFRERVCVDAGLLGEDGSRCRGLRQAEHLAAVLGPGQGEGAHRSGLAGASGGDPELQTSTRRTHLADQGCLPGIEGAAVCRHLQQRQIHRRVVNGWSVLVSGGAEETLLGVQDPLRGVEAGAATA